MKRTAVVLIFAVIALRAGAAGQAPEGPGVPEQIDGDIICVSPEDDTFITSVFTLTDIVIFSYHDSTSFRVLSPAGFERWSGMLDEGEYHTLFPGQGVFIIRGTQKYSVLVGDPLTDQAQGFYAVDQNNKGVSERFFTTQTSNWGGAQFIVFAYEDGTEGCIIDTRDEEIIDSFFLDSAEHYAMEGNWAPVEVSANKGVSVLSYGDQGYWVPAANGNFSGRLFYTFRGYIGSWPNDLNIIAYCDSTSVEISNTETEEILWEGELDDGEIYTLVGDSLQIYVTVQATEDVTCLVAPFVSYSLDYYRLYNGMDRSGRAIGNKFYHPTISGGRIDLYSFYDNNHIQVYNQSTGAPVWDGMLNSYDHYMLNTSNTLYRIESDSGVAFYDAWGDQAGAIFAPMWYAAFDSSAVLEDTDEREPGYEVLTTIAADELVITFGDLDPQSISVELYDVTGRRVDSYLINRREVRIDVSGVSAGVYFLGVDSGSGTVSKKVVVTR